MSKIPKRASRVHVQDGLEIFVEPKKAKRNGKDHIWVHIRQAGKKEWSIYSTQSYHQGASINFIRS